MADLHFTRIAAKQLAGKEKLLLELWREYKEKFNIPPGSVPGTRDVWILEPGDELYTIKGRSCVVSNGLFILPDKIEEGAAWHDREELWYGEVGARSGHL